MDSIGHDFKAGDVVYLRHRPSGAYTVEQVAGNMLHVLSARGVQSVGWYRSFTRLAMRGTYYSTLSDLELSRCLYDIECNVEPPTYYDPDDWYDYERSMESYACLRAEYLERQRDGGIWASGD